MIKHSKLRTLFQAPDHHIRGKRVFVRTDLNVPNFNVMSERLVRWTSLVQTVRYLIRRGARVTIVSHRGHFKKILDPLKHSIKEACPILQRYFDLPVVFHDAWHGHPLPFSGGQVVVLENIRFHPGEASCDLDFCRYLADQADTWVLDAISVAHRDHASVSGVARLIPAYVSYGVQVILKHLNYFFRHPTPAFAVLGGAKVSAKAAIIPALLDNTVETVVLTGALANTAWKAKSCHIGQSLHDPDYVPFLHDMLQRYGHRIIVPSYMVVDHYRIVDMRTNPLTPTDVIRDVGHPSLWGFELLCAKYSALVMNGASGCAELLGFERSFVHMVQYGYVKIACFYLGGGDTEWLLQEHPEVCCVYDEITLSAIPGGAMLEYFANRTLIGLMPYLEP
jgi:phosphoglycerate kinase